MSPAPQSGTRLVNSLTALSDPTHQEWLEQVLHLALTHRQQGGRILIVEGVVDGTDAVHHPVSYTHLTLPTILLV